LRGQTLVNLVYSDSSQPRFLTVSDCFKGSIFQPIVGLSRARSIAYLLLTSEKNILLMRNMKKKTFARISWFWIKIKIFQNSFQAFFYRIEKKKPSQATVLLNHEYMESSRFYKEID
jgi:hypothetical protein